MNELLINSACAFAGLGILLHIVQAMVNQAEQSEAVSSRDVFAYVAGAAALGFAAESLASVSNFGLVSQLTGLAALGLWIHLYYRASGGRVGSILMMSIGTSLLYGAVEMTIKGIAIALLPWSDGAVPRPTVGVGVCVVIGLLGIGLFLRHVRQEKMYREFAADVA